MFGGEVTVTVTLSRTTNTDYPGLARSLEETIAAATDRPVTIQLRFVDYESASGSTG